MKKILLTALAMLSLMHIASAQKTKLTGAWEMTGFNSDPTKGQTAIIQSKDDLTLLHRQPEGKWTVAGKGKVSDDKVVLTLTNAGLDRVESKTFVFDGNKTLISKGTNKTSESVALIRSSSFFVCGNHSPTNHVADSLKDMKRLTGQYKCALWHSSDSDEHTAAKLTERLIAMPARDEK